MRALVYLVAVLALAAVGCGEEPTRSDSCGDGFLNSDTEACDDGDANSDADPFACKTDCSSRCRCSRHLDCDFAGDSYVCTGSCPAGYIEYDGDDYERFCDLTDVTIEVVANGEAPVAAVAYDAYQHLAEVDADTAEVAVIVTVPPTVTVTVEGVSVPSGQASQPVALSRGSNFVDIELFDTVEGYTTGPDLLVQRGVAMTYIKASNTDADDRFGDSVAIDGDTLAVGASSEASAATGIDGDQSDDSAPRRGAVYVFRLVDGTWSQEAYIKSPDPAEELFSDVALSGDVLAVRGSVAVTVFRRIDGVWNVDATLPDSGCARNVYASGDTVAFGCLDAAHVYRRGDDGWALEQTITGADAPGEFDLTSDVAFAGDTLVAAGHKFLPTDEEEEVVTLVFRRDGAVWSWDDSLCPGGGFACSGEMVLAPDGNRLAVRAGRDPSNTARELIHVLTRGDAGWSEEAAIARALPPLGDTMALSGDRLAVRGVRLAGELAYFFVRDGGSWSADRVVAHPTLLRADSLWWSMAMTDDVWVTGAEKDDSAATGIDGDELDHSAPEAGAVFALDLP